MGTSLDLNVLPISEIDATFLIRQLGAYWCGCRREKFFDFDLVGVAKIYQMRIIPHRNLPTGEWTCLDFDMLPISEIDATYLIRQLEHIGVNAVEKSFDFDLGGVAKIYQMRISPHRNLPTGVWTCLDFDMLPISEIDATYLVRQLRG